MEKIDTGCDLFDVLIERRRLSEGDTNFLQEILTKVGREDLSETLKHFTPRTWCAAPGQREPSEAETGKIDVATDVIAANLGKTWRRLARKLGLSEVRIQSIGGRHLDLEETATGVIWEWRQAQGSQASVEQLVVALRECEQNLTADKVEDKIGLAEEKSSPNLQ